MILCVQHVACEEPGRIRAALERRGRAVRIVRTYAGEAVPRSARGLDGLVLMGGPMGVRDAARRPHLRVEMRLVEAALGAGVPVLGVCLGSQILAAVLGARVEAADEKEIGWRSVALGPAAATDGLFSGAPRRFVALHWHGDAFDAPAGAVALASSAMTPCQAFRWGRSAYGLLFHIEATPAIVAGMARSFAGELEEEGISAAALVAAARRRKPVLDRLAARVFGAWAETIGGPG